MKAYAPCLVLVLVVAALGQSRQSNTPNGPANGYVPDATTATKIAEAVLGPVFGEKRILSERPFHATLKDNVWTVGGTLYCANGKVSSMTNACFGGTAVVKISKADGRILFMTHYE